MVIDQRSSIGILRGRELATLYDGADMVARMRSTSGFTLAKDTTTEILQTNTRRIYYEVVLSLNSVTGAALIQVAPRSANRGRQRRRYRVVARVKTSRSTRSFREELDPGD